MVECLTDHKKPAAAKKHREGNMLKNRPKVLLFLSILLAGCTVEKGAIDFPNPLFQLRVGPAALIAFRSSTVLQVGSAYFTLSLPFYFPLALVLALSVIVILLLRRRNAPRG